MLDEWAVPVPHFTPTAEEWADFAAYVRKIVPDIEDFGGCTITPPPSWAWTPPSLDPAQQIRPIKQHLFRAGNGRSGCYTGIFEHSDASVSLGDFMEQAAQKTPSSTEPAEVQSLYWRRVVTGEAGVLYGSDTDAPSLFDPELKEWNLGALPGGCEGDLLQHLPLSLPGLNKPMLSFGCWRSAFCLHTEDSELSGLSFLHLGEPKYWCAVPTAAAPPPPYALHRLHPLPRPPPPPPPTAAAGTWCRPSSPAACASSPPTCTLPRRGSARSS